MKTLTDQEWQDARGSILHKLEPGPLLVSFAVDRIRRQLKLGRKPRSDLVGIRVNSNEPDYPPAPETGAWLVDRVAADPEVSARIAELKAVGFHFHVHGQGEAWYQAVVFAVEPDDEGEHWLRTEIKRRLGYMPPDSRCNWDDQFDAWIAQDYGGVSTGHPVDRPAGLR